MPVKANVKKTEKPMAKAAAPKKAAPAARITVQNVNVPGYTSTVDAGMYEAMRKALLKVLPRKSPGLTQSEMMAAVVPHLPQDLFPGGAKAGWWVKCVQLDLEAKESLVREAVKPLRWHKA
jgi:nitrogenase molybdenum-iron protein alpha/beta subunit